MKARLFICCAMLACSTLHARPRVIESNVRLPVDAIWVGHWGDQLIAIEEGADSSNPGQLLYTYSANLYHRSANGQWVFDHTLAYEASPEHRPRATVVMNATIAAITMANGLRIFERSGGAWTESTLDVRAKAEWYAAGSRRHHDSCDGPRRRWRVRSACPHAESCGEWALG